MFYLVNSMKKSEISCHTILKIGNLNHNIFKLIINITVHEFNTLISLLKVS